MPKILHVIFDKEYKGRRSDEKEYSKKIGQMNIRVKKRYDMIMELEQIGSTRSTFKEYMDLLVLEQQEDMKEIDFLNDRRQASVKRSKEFATMMVKLSKKH